MTRSKAIAEYREIFSCFQWECSRLSLTDFNAIVAKFVPAGAGPEAWIEAAKTKASAPCGRCGGSGMFVTGMLNGKLTGPGGECFRCGGKGRQNFADTQRNSYYDQNQRVSM
jgi:hypothetical protein